MLSRPGTYRILAALIVLTLPYVGWAAFQTLQANANSPLDWVPADFPARADYHAFREQFGSGDVVVMSWPGCTIEDPRLDRVAEYLRQSRNFFNEESQWDFERVTTGREVYERLICDPLNLPVEEAKRRLKGTLLGPDGLTTCAIVAFTPDALSRRREVVLTLRAMLKACDVPLADQHLVGPVIDGLAVDDAGRQSMSQLALPSAVIVFVVGWWSLESFRGACLVFGLSVYAQTLTLAMLHLGGETMSALLIVLPPLIQVLAVAGGIHLINYYWEFARTGPIEQAATRALEFGWLPCTLASATTALGLGSLMVSDLSPIRVFGAYGAAGVLVTTGLLLAVLPMTLNRWKLPIPESRRTRRSQDRTPWSLLTRMLSRFHPVVVAVAFGAMVMAGISLRNLQTSVRIETLFPANSRILQDYRWLEEHVAPLVPIEVVLRCPVNEQWPLWKQLALVQETEREISQLEEVSGTLSVHTFAPPDSVSQLMALSPDVRERVVASALPAMKELGYLAEADGELEWMPDRGIAKPQYRDWRITAHVSAVTPLDYGRILNAVRARVDPLISSSESRWSQKVRASYTGIMPLVHAIQHRLMADLVQSFCMAFVTITLVMMLLQGGFFMGLLAMVPNLFPALLILGGFAWAGITMDIGSVVTISLGLGIAVDDTLHFLVNFRRERDRGDTTLAAIFATYRHCGSAMVQTSVTCGLGLWIFSASEFLPTCRFAWMMLAFLSLALLGDLIVMPAILLNPLGRCFRPARIHSLKDTGSGSTEEPNPAVDSCVVRPTECQVDSRPCE